MSVSKLFYDKGWHGINVEPSAYYKELVRQRPRDQNVNSAVSDEDGEATFYLSAYHPDHSSLLDVHHAESITVPTQRLDTILARTTERIAFMKVDIEGYERQALGSNNWKRHRPLVLVIEAIEPHTHRPNHQDWEDIVLQAGYRYSCFDSINRFYYREDFPHLHDRLDTPLPTLFPIER